MPFIVFKLNACLRRYAGSARCADEYRAKSDARRIEGGLRLARTMLGEPGFTRRSDRRLGENQPHDLEANLLLDETARLAEDGIFSCQ